MHSYKHSPTSKGADLGDLGNEWTRVRLKVKGTVLKHRTLVNKVILYRGTC